MVEANVMYYSCDAYSILKENTISSLLSTRKELYDNLNYFENYRTEKYGSNNFSKFDFSASNNVLFIMKEI